MFPLVPVLLLLAALGLITYSVVLATRLVSAVERIAGSLPPPPDAI